MHLLALDQGTTSSRAIVFDGEGAVIASAQQEFAQHFPSPGLVEHNPEEIWETQLATAREAIRRAHLHARDIAAIGITNQRETTILWDRKTGKPLSRGIVWQDRRTAPICAELKAAGVEPMVRAKTGLVLDPYFSATKIRWLLEKLRIGTPQPGGGSPRLAMKLTDCAFGTVDSWLLYKLTAGQVHATDVSNAARTLLFNIHTLEWDQKLLDLFRIPREILPEVRSSASHFGTSDPGLLGEAIPITGIAGDQQAALFGQACFAPGMAKNTYGTGSFIVMNTGEQAFGDCQAPESNGVLSTIAWRLHDEPVHYALEASIFITGAAVQWLRDGLGLIGTSAEVEDLAASVPNSGGVYFVPALTGLGAPHWDPNARGLIIGLTRGTTKAHIARATLEAMAYQARDGIDAMREASGIALEELRADGGAAGNDLLMQFQADILNTPVLRPKVTETTALGAAYLAAIGAGLATQDDLAKRWQLDRRFEPDMKHDQREMLYAGWKRAVERSRGWVLAE